MVNHRNAPLATRRRRALRGLASLALLAPFLSAPTPGNIGGCGGTLASEQIQPHPGNTNVTLESTYFERSLCAGLCQRLYECGFLCTALTVDGLNCDNPTDAARAYYLCVHGTNTLRTEFFGVSSCPKSCNDYGGDFAYSNSGAFVYQWDVQVCTDAVLQRSCSVDPQDGRSVLSALRAAPSECANNNVCRPRAP